MRAIHTMPKAEQAPVLTINLVLPEGVSSQHAQRAVKRVLGKSIEQVLQTILEDSLWEMARLGQ